MVEESLYPAMEDFRIDVMTGDGAFARTHPDRRSSPSRSSARRRAPGLLTAPLLSRFGTIMRLDFYPVEDLAKIVRAERAACSASRSTTRGARASRGARAARRASPTGCCAACATSPRSLGNGTHRRAPSHDSAASASTSTRAGLDEMDRAPAARHHRGLRRRPGRRRDARRRAGRAARHHRGRLRALPAAAGLRSAGPPAGRVATRKASLRAPRGSPRRREPRGSPGSRRASGSVFS